MCEDPSTLSRRFALHWKECGEVTSTLHIGDELANNHGVLLQHLLNLAAGEDITLLFVLGVGLDDGLRFQDGQETYNVWGNHRATVLGLL